jgi:hypothetical protein
MAITLRTNKGSALTYDEMDKNFSQYFYSASRVGNTMTLYYTGSTNLTGYGPSRTIDINLNPAEGQSPNLVVQGANRSIQFREGSLLAGEATFVYSANNYLGIGTGQPSSLVEAKGNTLTPAVLKLTSHGTLGSNATNAAYMLFNAGATEVGAIGKIDGNANNIGITSLQPDSFLSLQAGTNPTSIISINGGTSNIGIGTSYPGAKLETAINGASGKTLIFGRGFDANFNLAGKQDKTDLGNAVDGAIIGSIGLDYINQENTAIRFHRGASQTGGYMSFTVKDGSTRMSLSNTGLLTLNSEFGYPSIFNAQGNAPGVNLYATVQNDATTQYSQAVVGVKAGNAQMFQLGQNRDGYGFLYNPNNAPIYFMTNGTIRVIISGQGSVGIGIGGNIPEGILHVYQPAPLSSTTNSFTLLKTFQHRGGSTGTNNMFIRDYARRNSVQNTSDDWATWNHHNSIDVDGAHNTPGTDTLTWWERHPWSGSQAFGSRAVKTLDIRTIDSRVDVTGSLNVSSNIVKTGGTSTQALMADGSTKTLSNSILAAGTVNAGNIVAGFVQIPVTGLTLGTSNYIVMLTVTTLTNGAATGGDATIICTTSDHTPTGFSINCRETLAVAQSTNSKIAYLVVAL